MKKIISLLLVILLFSGCSNDVNDEKSNLQIYFFSVGHGDAALVMCDGHNMMIDCGGSKEGTQSLSNKLDDLQIKDFDYIFVTHPHEDHYSLFKEILEGRTIKKGVYCSTTSEIVNNSSFNEFANSIKASNMKIKVPKIGDTFNLGPNATIDVLSVNAEKYDEKNSHKINNSSIILMITHGDNRFVVTGDAEKKAQLEAKNQAKENENLKSIECDVLKVAHHDSNCSWDESFLEEAKPKYAVFSLASYEVIDGGVLDILGKNDTLILRTDEKGIIKFSSDMKNITFE